MMIAKYLAKYVGISAAIVACLTIGMCLMGCDGQEAAGQHPEGGAITPSRNSASGNEDSAHRGAETGPLSVDGSMAPGIGAKPADSKHVKFFGSTNSDWLKFKKQALIELDAPLLTRPMAGGNAYWEAQYNDDGTLCAVIKMLSDGSVQWSVYYVYTRNRLYRIYETKVAVNVDVYRKTEEAYEYVSHTKLDLKDD